MDRLLLLTCSGVALMCAALPIAAAPGTQDSQSPGSVPKQPHALPKPLPDLSFKAIGVKAVVDGAADPGFVHLQAGHTVINVAVPPAVPGRGTCPARVKTTLFFDVRNTGAGAAPALMPGQGVVGMLGGVAVNEPVAPVAAGASSGWIAAPVYLPVNQALTISVTVNPNQAVAESNSGNNAFAARFTLACAQP